MSPASRTTFYALLILTTLIFGYLLYFVFMQVPTAQEAAGGLAQKIFYFHVPAAYGLYLSGTVCGVASAAYLVGASDRRDALARAGAECAVIFGLLVLTSGPLWARKAWGVYWAWEPRLLTSLLSVLVYMALVVVRAFAGAGEAERKFAAAFGVLGTATLPIIHFAVKKWGGNHPAVISGDGGGLGHPDMSKALIIGFGAMTLLCILFLWSRYRLAVATSQLSALEERAAAEGLTE